MGFLRYDIRSDVKVNLTYCLGRHEHFMSITWKNFRYCSEVARVSFLKESDGGK